MHEETGWLLDESTVERIGFLHFQHTTPKPADYTYLYPDFLQVVYTGTADSRDESQGEAWTDVEGWELGNDLYTLAELKSVEIDPTQRPFLDRIARLLYVGGRLYGAAMRYSVTTGAAGYDLDPARLAELAALAEASGWDAFFLEDYLIYQGQLDTPTWDPWVCLAAMAAATRRLRLGTTVTPVPRRRPWKLASEAVSIDRLSGGRLTLGVGLGDGSDPSLSTVGEATEPTILAEQLDESLAILAELWSGRSGTSARTTG